MRLSVFLQEPGQFNSGGSDHGPWNEPGIVGWTLVVVGCWLTVGLAAWLFG